MYEYASDIHTIPNKIGAYIITHKYNNIYAEKYVGSTKNLRIRMCGHCDKKIISIDLFITNNIELAKRLERILINLIKPATNKHFPLLSNEDKELMKELLKDVQLKELINTKINYGNLKYIKYDEKEIFPVIRKARKARKNGESVILTLTDFAQEKDFYIVKKEGNIITLTNINLENVENTLQVSPVV